MLQPKQARKRILFLDWMRGLAALIMLQGHTFHSYTRPELRDHGFYLYSQFFGGEAAAVFLFLTGITYGLGMSKRENWPVGQRILAALKRARYLFLIGILFRLQMYLFAVPYSRLRDLLIVDILNLMGAAAALLAFVAIAQDPLRRLRWAALTGVAIAGFSPLISDLYAAGALDSVPKFLRDYIVPGSTFSIFPWGCYLAFGLAAGNAIPLIKHQHWPRIMPWAALCGFGFIYGGIYFSSLDFSIYPSAEFWVDSPALAACKLGVILLIGAAAFLWTEYFSPTGWSFVRLLGTTSLPVYWVHVELVYGVWSTPFKQRLTPVQCVFAAGVLIALMVAMSYAIQTLPWRLWLKQRRFRPRASGAVATEVQ